MKSDSPEILSERAPKAASTADVFLQVGSITRLLHDTLAQVGVMPNLQIAANGLPDARSRLNYIADKTAAAIAIGFWNVAASIMASTRALLNTL